MSLFNFVLGTAYAAESSPQQGSGSFSLVLMTLIFILFMYFVMWRPQNRRAKEHRDLLTSLAKGDEVVTAGGILGKIAKINEQYIVLALSETVEITIQRSSIAQALPKGTIKAIV